MIFRFCFFLLLLLGSSFSQTLDECQNDYENWSIKYNEFIGNKTCNSTPFNCESHHCIETAIGIVIEFNENNSRCKPTGFEVPQNILDDVQKLGTLGECNTCVVIYTYFENKQESLKNNNCWDKLSCEPECVAGFQEYHDYYEKMMKTCKPKMNGGCGDRVGMTEGEIYETLSKLYRNMTKTITFVTLCDPYCKSDISDWYDTWKNPIQNKCIVSEHFDIVNDDLFLSHFNLDRQCDPECMDEVDKITVKYVSTVSSGCRTGLTSEHWSALVNSVNKDKCASILLANSEGLSLDTIVARGFFTLFVVCIGTILLYILYTMTYRRFYLNQRGWEIVPTFGMFKSTKKQKRENRKMNEDEEGLVAGSDEEENL